MQRRRWITKLVAAAMVAIPVGVIAQFTVPKVIDIPGDVAGTLGGTVFINHGLVGMGRISASQIDPFGESFGSVSGLQITNWAQAPSGAYTGTFNILPDRGFNANGYFADYAARIAQVNFAFTPYTGAANIGGTTVAERVLAQSQVVMTSGITGIRFTYDDPVRGSGALTTGLDPGIDYGTLFGRVVPYVHNYTGVPTPAIGETPRTFENINKLALDAEALILKPDGSGYIGDEYGGNVYYFDSTKKIVGVIIPPLAMQPHRPLGTPFFGGAPNPDNGRRPNQGLEGVALTPDGTRLFVLLQSGTMQDSGSENQTRRNTRLLVYDVDDDPTPNAPVAEYALTLPTHRGNGNGTAVNNTSQQSEIVMLDNSRFLVLARDGNGLGQTNNNRSVHKVVLLVDLTVGAPTEFASDPTRNSEGAAIADVTGTGASMASTLKLGITGLSSTEAINMLNTAQLNKFNVALDTGAAVTKLTLGEKWEGFGLVPALDPAAPNDYFLFIGNDNDFLVSDGRTLGPDPSLGLIQYNGFGSHPAARVPPLAGSPNNESDTVFMVYRVTITTTPTVQRGGFVFDRRTQRFHQQITVQNTSPNTLTGPIYVALDGLSANAALANAGGVTAVNAPLGRPYIQVVAAGTPLAPGASATVTLQFTNSTMGAITYTPRVLVLTGPVTP